MSSVEDPEDSILGIPIGMTEHQRLVARVARLQRLEGMDAPEVVLEHSRQLVLEAQVLAATERLVDGFDLTQPPPA